MVDWKVDVMVALLVVRSVERKAVDLGVELAELLVKNWVVWWVGRLAQWTVDGMAARWACEKVWMLAALTEFLTVDVMVWKLAESWVFCWAQRKDVQWANEWVALMVDQLAISLVVNSEK